MPIKALDVGVDSHVYLLWAEGTDSFKIGYTKHSVDERASIIEAYSPVPLTVLAFVPGTQRLERSLHKRFEQWRLHSEWFRIPLGVVRDQLFLCFGLTHGGESDA